MKIRPPRLAGLVAFIGGLALILAAVLSSSLTAAIHIPSAGTISNSTTPIDANSLKPTGCTAINVTGITSGSGTITATSSAQLILASASADVITATGPQDNCIIGGDGNDQIHAGSGKDYVDGGPGTNECWGNADTTFVNCAIEHRY